MKLYKIKIGGVFGFPITIQDIDYQDEIKIVGVAAHNFDTLNDLNATIIYKNPIQHNKNGTKTNGSKVNTSPILNIKLQDNKPFYTAENISYKIRTTYFRLLGVRK